MILFDIQVKWIEKCLQARPSSVTVGFLSCFFHDLKCSLILVDIERPENSYFIHFNRLFSYFAMGSSTVWITTNCGKFLKRSGIPDHHTYLLRNLFAGQDVTVRTKHGIMDWFQIGKWVRLGCILSPCLFNLHAECLAGWSTSWNQDCQEKYQ